MLRRLNLAPGGTAALVRMREELLRHLRDHPDLRRVDRDFAHLFASWFNRGFLGLRTIDWNTPAISFYRSIGAVGMEEWTVQRISGRELLALAQAPQS